MRFVSAFLAFLALSSCSHDPYPDALRVRGALARKFEVSIAVWTKYDADRVEHGAATAAYAREQAEVMNLILAARTALAALDGAIAARKGDLGVAEAAASAAVAALSARVAAIAR